MTEYRFNIQGDVNISLMRELIDEFIDPENYEVTDSDDPDVILINKTYSADRDTVKRELYRKLCELTGKRQEWGALTGVRPVKLAGELIESIGYDAAREKLSEFYYMSDEKIDHITSMYLYQKELFGFAELFVLREWARVSVFCTRAGKAGERKKGSAGLSNATKHERSLADMSVRSPAMAIGAL